MVLKLDQVKVVMQTSRKGYYVNGVARIFPGEGGGGGGHKFTFGFSIWLTIRIIFCGGTDHQMLGVSVTCGGGGTYVPPRPP